MDVKEALTKSALQKVLENLPENLSDTYRRIILRTSHSPGGHAKLDTMRRVFRWITVARRPLHIHELEEAIALDSTDTYLHTDRLPRDAGVKLVSDCGNLVILDNIENTVAFAHYTIKQFLFATDEYDTKFSNLIDLTTSDTEVGNICLAYLNFSDFETQLAKAPAQVHVEVEAPLAEGLVWTNVPFGGHIRDLFIRGALWLTRAATPKVAPLKFAVPVRSSPRESLHQKYTLLEYIIEHWVYHTSGLGPNSAGWQRFRHLALYRQMDFEFRPWNESVHQKLVDATIETSKETLEKLRQDRQISTTWDDYAAQLAIYAWAMVHNIGSLFGLLDREILGPYFCIARTETFPTWGLNEAWSTRYNDLEALLDSTQTPCHSSEPPNTPQQCVGGWKGTSTVRLLHGVSVRWTEAPSYRQLFYLFLEAEITRWAGPNTWTELIIGAAVCAMQFSDQIVFDAVWRRCDKDRLSCKLYSVDWQNSTSFKAIEALLCAFASHLSSTHLEWTIIFILERYLTAEQLRWTIEYSPTCKTNARISQTLFVVALASKQPIRHIVELWVRLGSNSKGVRPFDPVGSWRASGFGSPDYYLAIRPFQQVNVLALVEELAKFPAQQLHISTVDNLFIARARYVNAMSFVLDTWDKYGRCFSVGIFENDNIPLLRRAIEQGDLVGVRALVPLYEKYLKEINNPDFLVDLQIEEESVHFQEQMVQILEPLLNIPV